MKQQVCIGLVLLQIAFFTPVVWAKNNANVIGEEKSPYVEQETTLMGTEVIVLISLASQQEENDAQKAISAAFDEIRRVEDLMTDWREDSPLQAINRAAGKSPVVIDDEILFVLREAKKISDMTQGAFDVTYAPLGKVWGNFVTPKNTIADDQAIQKVLPLVNYRNLTLDFKKNTAFLKKPGMRVGLGGIAKGYAVDKAGMVLEKMGYKNFVIKAGGDMIVRGRRNGKLWWIGIKHPRKPDQNIAILPVSNVSISTSGDYERFYMIDGKRYPHIISPKTGYPVDGCESVTILAKHTYLTDGLSTGVFVLGPVEGKKFIEKSADLQGMIVDSEQRLWVSKGLETK